MKNVVLNFLALISKFNNSIKHKSKLNHLYSQITYIYMRQSILKISVYLENNDIGNC